MSAPKTTSTSPAPAPIRIRAYYQTAGALLRELSRALNKGCSAIRAESGLPVGSRLGLVMQTAALRSPIEVTGTVTAVRRRGDFYELVVRYDFDFLRFRSVLVEAVAALKKESPTRRPRVEPRFPVALSVDAERVAKGASVTVQNFSGAGCRLELRGGRFPRVEPGSRIELTMSGPPGARPLALVLDVRWVGVIEMLDKGRSMVLGGRFRDLPPEVRDRIGPILDFKDHQPRLRIRRIVARGRSTRRSRGHERPRHRR